MSQATLFFMTQKENSSVGNDRRHHDLTWWVGDLKMGFIRIPFIQNYQFHVKSPVSLVWVHPSVIISDLTIGKFSPPVSPRKIRLQNAHFMCNEKAPNLLKTQSGWKPRWVFALEHDPICHPLWLCPPWNRHFASENQAGLQTPAPIWWTFSSSNRQVECPKCP